MKGSEAHNLKDEELPREMQKMTPKERKEHLEKVEKRRDELRKKALELDKKRSSFIEEKLARDSKAGKDGFDNQVLEESGRTGLDLGDQVLGKRLTKGKPRTLQRLLWCPIRRRQRNWRGRRTARHRSASSDRCCRWWWRWRSSRRSLSRRTRSHARC